VLCLKQASALILASGFLIANFKSEI